KLDHKMQEENVAYIRFSDDIKVFCSDNETATSMFSRISEIIKGYGLKLSEKKCGIFKATSRTYYGYEFTNTRNGIVVQRKSRNAATQIGHWKAAKIEWRDNAYHIISDDILTKKDFSILFENPEKKMYIPVEAATVISVYSDIILSSDLIKFVADHRLTLRFHDKHGEYAGSFFPSYQKKSVKTTIAQSLLYSDKQKRLQLAKKIIIAGTQNIKSNIQYYNRRYDNIDLSDNAKALSEFKKLMNEADSIERLMLTEARMRETYFSCFDSILHADGFKFERRSRRPPKNEVNALISFGNTILYGYIADAIQKTDLDIRIAFLHSANRRSQSLNLDIAELFKPVIVDRLIFSLINKHIIVAHKHFTANDYGSFLLNREGKSVFLSAFKDKLSQRIDVKGEKFSYAQLISREVWNLRGYILQGDKYTPFKCGW
ncbi:MAG: type I-B CRISPR-associated endonuclease Cas1b, partial [Clostridiales bacterium]|nr:type I-B CRISPR-associated endonuclease Cas1b [Clostridiales bacterium]